MTREAIAASDRPAGSAWGRWLGDFVPLSVVERELVEAAGAGRWCRPGQERPAAASEGNRIRADLVRFLALGGDADHPVHEAGVQVAGAFVAGSLKLSACDVSVRISLIDCILDAPIHAFDTTLRALNLTGSKIAGLRADRVAVTGNLSLRRGFESDGPVSLAEARIGGGIDASGGRFAGNAVALDVSGATIEGPLYLSDGFVAAGPVRIVGARIGGDLIASGGRFENDGGVALGADAARVAGNALLDGVDVHGTIRLAGAGIGGHLSLERARIAGEPLAVQAEHLSVGHALILRDAEIAGRVMMTDARAGSLADDLSSWPTGRIVLDGFQYDRIAGHAVSAEARIEWLMRQIPDDVGATFRPQPWEQLIRVLRDMGHNRGATLVAIAKQRAMRRAGTIGNRAPRTDFAPWWRARPRLLAIRRGLSAAASGAANLASRLLHDAYGMFAGFGYRPERIAVWMLAAWAACGLYFAQAARAGIIAPAEPTLLIAALDGTKRPNALVGPGDCGVRNEVAPKMYWASCPGLPSEYPHFNAWLFSADLILPVVDFRQFTFWAPAATYTTRTGDVRPMTGGLAGKLVQWFEVLFGWTMSLLFGAIVTRLVERD